MRRTRYKTRGTPDTSSINSDITSWNQNLSGEFVPYPIATDTQALHRDPYRWNPGSTSFSDIKLNKEGETFTFDSDGCFFPLSSFSSVNNDLVLRSKENGFGIKPSEFQIETSNATITSTSSETQIICGTATETISPSELSFSSGLAGKPGISLNSTAAGIALGPHVCAEGLHTGTSSINPILIPFRRMSDEMTFTRNATMDYFSFIGYNEMFAKATGSREPAIFTVNLGGPSDNGIFTFDDNVSFPNDSSFHPVGLLKLNAMQFESLMTAGDFLKLIFKTTKIMSLSDEILSNIKLTYGSSSSIWNYFTHLRCEYFNPVDGSTVTLAPGEEVSLLTLVSYARLHPEIPELSSFLFYIRNDQSKFKVSTGTKLFCKFSVKKSGGVLTISIDFEYAFFSRRDAVYKGILQNTKLINSTTICRDVLAGAGKTPAKAIQFVMHFCSSDNVQANLDISSLPLQYGITTATKVYYEIGKCPISFFDSKLPVTSESNILKSYPDSYYSKFTSLFLPQNISFFNFSTGQDQTLVDNLVIPYTPSTLRSGVHGIYATGAFARFKHLSQGILIFNGDKDYVPDYNWKPQPGCFANMGTGSTQHINLFLTCVQDEDEVNAAKEGSLATIDVFEWANPPKAFSRCTAKFHFIFGSIGESADSVVIDSFEGAMMSPSIITPGYPAIGGTISELLERTVENSFSYEIIDSKPVLTISCRTLSYHAV